MNNKEKNEKKKPLTPKTKLEITATQEEVNALLPNGLTLENWMSPENIKKVMAEKLAEIMADEQERKTEQDKEEAPQRALKSEYNYFEVKGTPNIVIPISRKQNKLIDKAQNALWQIEEFFIDEQEARNNSIYTIRYYQRIFKKLYEAVAFIYSAKNKDTALFIDSLMDSLPENWVGSPYSYAGRMLPIVVLEDITLPKEIVKFFKEIDDGVKSEQTINSFMRGYRAIVNYCNQQGWISAQNIKVSERKPNNKNCYTDSELKKLERKPDYNNFTEYRNWVIIEHLLSTGNRIQTIINIKLADVDLEEGYINCNVQKNKVPTRIPIVKKYKRILKEYISYYRTDEEGNILEDEYLFCNRYGEKMTDKALQRAISEYNRKRGVNKTSIHLFRHTFAKNWITSDGDIVSLSKILGHSSLKMVQDYANLYSSDVKEKAEKSATINKGRVSSGRTLKPRKID